ncbi:MAG TPA: CheR family methyltransferase [Candidatus Dormibacteraeota bacterium]|nr:CheR family methyltransferase [Candidatus Dormibacteraeota bacterium]
MTLDAGPQFETLIEYLRESRGVDFTGYKRASLVRRVAKRCSELNIENFTAYLDYLQVHPDEFQILFDKILINVTEFFRDPQSWEYLRDNIVPRIVAKPGHIRVWSSGTASGEEAYSIAMLLCDALEPEQFLRRVKIYATDIDEDALNKARTGYLAKDLETLPEEYKAKFFEPQGSRFVFKSSLRRTLIFGRHDLMQDAPISRLDLLICRNTLMYFTAETQGRVLARFHYALNDDGYLFLGRAEMLLTHGALFAPVDLKQRIFSKVARLQLRERLILLAQSGSAEASNHVARQLRVRELATEGVPYAQLVIDALGVVATANAAARRMFDIPPGDIGRPLKDLELSYKPMDVRTPIERVYRERRPLTTPGVEFQLSDGAVRLFDVHVAPLIDDDGSVVGTSVSFVDVTNVTHLRSELERSKQEVETAYEELQSSNEELETTNEELQSTVEELETTNEELQSSNEELETMNEELESTNAELQAINTDLRVRTDEVARLNTFLSAITGNIEVGATVLDLDMNVQVWNERAADLWGLRSDEVVGKPFFDLDIGLPTRSIRDVARHVLRGTPLHETIVVDAVTRRGKQIRCRVLVHALTDGDRSTGLVVVMEEVPTGKPVPA